MIRRYLPPISLLAFHLFLLVHLRFTAWPEMFSYPYLKNHGFLLYRDMVYPYPPVLTLTLSYLYKLFGYKLSVLEWFSWSVILFSTVCVWLLAKQVGKSERAGIVAAACYVFLQPFLDGNMLWFDIAIVPPVILGTLFLLRKNLLWSGMFFALAAFTKQTAGLFYIVTLIIVLRETPIRSRLARLKVVLPFLIGPLVLGVPFLIRLWQERAIGGFWNWVVWYPITQWSKFPGYVQMSLGRHDGLVVSALFTLLLMLILAQRKIVKQKGLLVILSMTAIGLMAVYPRFSFFHFQVVLAFWAVALGILLNNIKWSVVNVATSFVIVIFIFRLIHYPVLRTDWNKEARFYGNDDLAFAQELKATTKSADKVFLQGISSQYYVMADRLPPKPWADNYVWYLEIPSVQEQILSGWEVNKPDVVIWKSPGTGAWYKPGVYQPQQIVNFVAQNYTKDQELRPGIWVWRKKELVVSEVEL